MGAKHIIYTTAILLLIIGSIASAYVFTSTTTTDQITIQGEEYSIEQLFYIADQRTITVESTEYTGAALDDLIKKVGVSDYQNQQYTFIASDYQQTVEWDDLSTGVFTEKRRCVFSDLPKKFWVCNIIEIEVK